MRHFKIISLLSVANLYKASVLLICLEIVGLSGCKKVEVTHTSAPSVDSVLQNPNAESIHRDSTPPISPLWLSKLVPADGFDFPVAPPDAKSYYKARGFLPKGLEHLGEDWNGPGGGNRDFGDKVYSTANGVVFFSAYVGPGWGTVVRILHNFGTSQAPLYIESLYAHVSSAWVRPGWRVDRGEIVGTIGNADGKYHAHLHFEMRLKPCKDIGCGYDGDTLGFVDPTAFIEAHRPVRK